MDIIKLKKGVKPEYSLENLKLLCKDGKFYQNKEIKYADRKISKTEEIINDEDFVESCVVDVPEAAQDLLEDGEEIRWISMKKFGDWVVYGQNGQVLVRCGRPSEIALWATENLPQYRKQIMTGKNGYTPKMGRWNNETNRYERIISMNKAE